MEYMELAAHKSERPRVRRILPNSIKANLPIEVPMVAVKGTENV